MKAKLNNHNNWTSAVKLLLINFVFGKNIVFIFKASKAKIKRVQAVFDCEADNDDELSFSEGEMIVVSREADPEWWVSYSPCVS